MNLLTFGFAARAGVSGTLLTIGTAQTVSYGGNLLTVGMAQRQSASGRLLTVGMAQIEPKRRFNAAAALGLGVADFDLAVFIGGAAVDICPFADTMTITHGENEAYTCSFVLQQEISTPAIPVDLYQWYGKEIVIDLVHGGGIMRLYKGIVDSVQLDFQSGKTKIDCTDRRQRMADRLSSAEIQAVGHYSTDVQGEFDNRRDELEARLSTVPASYEFDVWGAGYLNGWKAGEPVRTLTECDVYYREPRVQLATVGQVVNKVNIELGYSYTRLLQRNLRYSYDLGLGICSRGYDKFPTLEGFKSACSETGWSLGGFTFDRDPPSQWVTCGDGSTFAWVRGASNEVVVGGQFDLVKRWEQNIGEKVTVTLSNAASIARYEALEDNVSASVSAEAEYEWDAYKTGAHETDHRTITGGGSTRPPKTAGVDFIRAPNGDWYADLADAGNARAAAFNVLYWQAYTKILASHRQNTLDLQIKFLPEISLRHTHRINYRNFSGSIKVARFTHTFDFIYGTGETDVTYRFFQAPIPAAALTPPQTPARPQTVFASYAKNHRVERTDLDEEESDSKAYGAVYRLTGVSQISGKRLPKYKLMFLRIKTPEIEKQSTDAAEAESRIDFAVGIYSDDVVIRI